MCQDLKENPVRHEKLTEVRESLEESLCFGNDKTNAAFDFLVECRAWEET